MTTVLGVDGCKGGWLAAEVGPSGISWQLFASARDFLAHPCDVVAVDIPIGLPASGVRQCDVLARRALPGQASSVFSAPVRPVLGAQTYAEARAISVGVDGRSLSAQCFGIVPKIAEVDRALRGRSGAEVLEVHPEVSFRALTRDRLPSKRTAAGRDVRLAALRTWLPVELPSPPPGRAAIDDCLDALVCAWTGARWLAGEAQVLGGEVDATGQVMRIVV